jgi:hypothetical protein
MRTKTHSAWLAAVAVAAALSMVVLFGRAAAPAQAGPETPEDAVIDWNANALQAIFTATTASPRPGAGQAPNIGGLHVAMVQGAVYDAVNMIDGGHEPYLDGLPSAPADASKAAAAATAAYQVLDGLGIAPVPALPQATKDWLKPAYDTYIAGLPADGKKAGIDAGAAAAAKMLDERTGDGRYVSGPPSVSVCGEDPGEWRPTATNPASPPGVIPLTCVPTGVLDGSAWVGNVTPFSAKSSSQFRTRGPHALTSRKYAEEYDEVKSLGGNGTTTPSERTQAQTQMAWFFTVNPVPMYHATFRAIAKAEGLSLVEQARLFGLLGLSGADAFINCWNDKAHYSFWRPITAIRLGDSDTNTKTVGDASWTSLVAAPPYPDHPSGYNCITGATMRTGKAVLGDRTSFTLNATPTIAGVSTPMTRSYSRFWDVTEDTIVARMYQGIHFRTPDEQGAELGKSVANWVAAHELQPR